MKSNITFPRAQIQTVDGIFAFDRPIQNVDSQRAGSSLNTTNDPSSEYGGYTPRVYLDLNNFNSDIDPVSLISWIRIITGNVAVLIIRCHHRQNHQKSRRILLPSYIPL